MNKLKCDVCRRGIPEKPLLIIKDPRLACVGDFKCCSTCFALFGSDGWKELTARINKYEKEKGVKK